MCWIIEVKNKYKHLAESEPNVGMCQDRIPQHGGVPCGFPEKTHRRDAPMATCGVDPVFVLLESCQTNILQSHRDCSSLPTSSLSSFLAGSWVAEAR